MDKLVGWQFTETGAGKEIPYEVDVSIVKNEFFREFVKQFFGGIMNFRKFITKILVVLIIMQLILLNYVCAEEIQNSEINQNSEELKIS